MNSLKTDLPVRSTLAFSKHPTVLKIEQHRKLLETTPGLLMDREGIPGPFDDQTISKAVGGSKNRANCIRLAEAAHQHGHGGVVELGTNLGISCAYLAVGARQVRDSAPIATGDCSGKRLRIAELMHRTCGIYGIQYVQGFFEATAERIFALIPDWTLAFIDGDHTFEGTMKYYRIAKTTARPGCMIIFDDIDWSDDMKAAWEMIASAHTRTARAEGGMGFVEL